MSVQSALSQHRREANGNQSVPASTVVELRFIGYDIGDDTTDPPTPPQPVYVFNCARVSCEFGLMAIHDHRDNITGGGFAFAV